MRTWGIGCVVVLALCTGCAGYKIERDGEGKGYDFYAPEPYLLGTPKVVEASDAKVLAYDFSIVYLPNYSKRYRVSSWAGMGKASFTFEFADGWKLTKLDDQSDNTNVLEQITGLVKHILPTDPFHIAKEGKTAAGEVRVAPLDKPVLYRFDYDSTGRISCLRRLDPGNLGCDLSKLQSDAQTPCAVRSTR